MRRSVPALLALVLLAGLVVATVLSAHSTDRGALGNAAAVGPLPSGEVKPPAPVSCSIVPGEAGPAGLSVRASGACQGVFSGSVECTGDDEALNASAQAVLSNGLRLTLSVIVPDPGEAGRHPDVALFAQVNRPGFAQRWSNRDTAITTDERGTITVAATLDRELATGTPGTLTLRGKLRCRNEPDK